MSYLRRFVVIVVAAFMMVGAAPITTASAITVPPTPVSTPEQLPTPPLLVSAYQISGGSLQFVQLYNNSNELIDLAGGAVVYTFAGDTAVQELVQLSGLMKPRSHIIVAVDGVLFGSAVAHFHDTAPGVVAGIDSLTVLFPGTAPSSVPAALKTNGTIQQRGKTSTGYSSVTFGNFDGVLYADALYDIPASPPMRVVEISPRAKACEPFAPDPACGDYIKLKVLPGFDAANLANYQMRTSEASDSVTTTFSLVNASQHGEYLLLRLRDDGQLIALTNSGGYVWLEDAFGATRYDETLTQYADAGSEKFIDQSWGLDERDGVWKWATPHPTGANQFPEVLAVALTAADPSACPAGKYRNSETNRCRSLEETVSALAVCDEGKERNPLTNRCRAVAVQASATLVPCDEGQERNPATNRCRKVESAQSSLAPCATGQERNPATNRCRKIAGVDAGLTAPAAVSPEQLGGNTLQTVLIATVGIAALSYGVFEWRQELWRLSRRAAAVFSGK